MRHLPTCQGHTYEDCWPIIVFTYTNMEMGDISMDFIMGLPRTAKGYDSVWVIIDQLTKIAHFFPVKVKYPVIAYAELYIARILSLHGVPKTIVSDRGSSIRIQIH
jgi:hypothetical protein